MTSEKKLKIAIAGAGVMGRSHLGFVQASALCDVSAIVDPSPAGADVAAQAGVPYFADLESMLAAQRPDGVILATPNHLHVDQALMCLQARIPALIEKPVAHTLEQGERLLAAEMASPTKLLVGHHRAHSAILSQGRALIREGLLGKLVAVNGSATFYKPADYYASAPWRSQPGGGPILINMIHEIGNLRSLCGEIVAVQAMASSATRHFEVEDTVAISLRFENGALGTFLLSDAAASARSWEQTSRENPDYPTYADEDCYVISGTMGSLSMPTMRLKRYGRPEDASWFKPFETSTVELQRADPLERQLVHFCDVIRGVAEPLVSLRDGVQNLRVTDAIARSARTGMPVRTDGLAG